MNIPDAFNDFHGRLQLGSKAVARINSAYEALSDWLTKTYGLPPGAVFLQGSYANNTATAPADKAKGEYDVDLVVERDWAGSADDVLNELEKALAGHETYKKMLRRKDPCVRLQYAPDKDTGGFHVDLIPARVPPPGSDNSDAPLEVPRRGAGWRGTNPKGYADWCTAQGDAFARTVMMLKRWREVHQAARASVKSIVLQVLTAKGFSIRGYSGSDAQNVVNALHGMQDYLASYPSSAPPLENSSLLSEDLTKRWPPADYRNFVRELNEAVELAEKAMLESDLIGSYGLWRRLFGDDFPPPLATREGARECHRPHHRRARTRLRPHLAVSATERDDLAPWFERHPERLEWELAQFAERGLSAREVRSNDSVSVETELTFRGQRVSIRVEFPYDYPDSPPTVFGPAGLLDRHQNPFDGNFCVLRTMNGTGGRSPTPPTLSLRTSAGCWRTWRRDTRRFIVARRTCRSQSQAILTSERAS
jgi:hypothetical protein